MQQSPHSFDVMVGQISEKYCAASDLTLGWRFLYAPKSTIVQNTGLAIFGYNPGGSSFETPIPSVEGGNAWLTTVERWPSANTQANFMRFMGKVVRPYAHGDPAQYFGRCLTTNVVPFRTASAADVPRWAHSWSIEFWTRHFELLRSQRVIVTVGNSIGVDARSPFAGLTQVFGRRGAALMESDEWPSGWGDHVVRYRKLSIDGSQIVIVGVPHFSRFDTRDPQTIARVSALLG